MLPLSLQLIFVCAVAYVLYRRFGSTSGRQSLPPGPPGYPIIGHLGVVPHKSPERAYIEWGRKYGSDLIRVSIFEQSIVVVNSVEAATEMLEKHGSIYSDRPAFPYFMALGYHDHLTFMSSRDPMFVMHRRLVQNAFSKAESRKFTTIQENEARKLVRRVLRDPKAWKRLLRLFSTAVIMQIMTGQEVKGPDDEYVRIAEDINNAISGGPPLGASGLDVFPWLKHLPSWCDPTGSTRYVRTWAHAIHDVQVVPYERVMKEIRAGSAKPSLVADMVLEEEARAQRGESPLLTPERIQGIIGAVYGAAQETTADTLVVFTFAITMHPEVQKKAKAELNAVLGPDRLPEIADREHLPYIERVVQETFRFWPTIPLGVPRRAREDDVYKGMSIPEGSLILTNSTAITHDERVYSKPWKFDPDRYLPKEQGGRGEPMAAPHFGYGRRVCPGRFTGENSVFIAIATMLHVLSFDKVRDEEGKDITVDAETTEYGGGLGSYPLHVPCVISAANEHAAELVAGYEA